MMFKLRNRDSNSPESHSRNLLSQTFHKKHQQLLTSKKQTSLTQNMHQARHQLFHV